MLNIRNVVDNGSNGEKIVVDQPLPRVKHARLLFALTISAIVIGEGERNLILTEVIDKGCKRSRLREVSREELEALLDEWRALGGGVE